MIKVKIFADDYDFDAGKYYDCESAINEFLENNDVEVIDIKFQISSNTVERKVLLLIYKEKGDK